MKVWEMQNDVNNYIGYFLKNDSDKEVLEDVVDKILGNEIISDWTPLEIIEDPEDSNSKKGDFPNLWSGSIPIVSDQMKVTLEKNGIHASYYPLINCSTDVKYYFMGIFDVVDALDKDKSVIKKFSTGHVMSVKKFVFKKGIQLPPIFKLLYDNDIILSTSLFVTDEFKSIVEKEDLKGIKFELIWDSDE